MASQKQCVSLLIKELQLRQFEISEGEPFRDFLEKLTDENETESKKERSDRREKRNRIKKRLQIFDKELYNLGNGSEYGKLYDALEALIKRDYRDLYDFDGSQKLQIFIPDELLTDSSEIVGEEEGHDIVDDFDSLSINVLKLKILPRDCSRILKMVI